MADSSKTEKATPKKRQDERKKGNIFQSRDIVTLVSVFLTFMTMRFLFPYMIDNITTNMEKYISLLAEQKDLTESFMFTVGTDITMAVAVGAFPIMAVAVAAGIIGTGVQTRFLVSGKKITPDLKKLNPLTGIKNMFTAKSLVELLKNAIKITVIGFIVYQFISGQIITFAKMLSSDLVMSVNTLLNAIVDLIIYICMLFFVLAGFDYMYQRWDYERQIRMSKEEIKEEYKQIEGDPKIKGKIKDMQRKIAMSRMMQAVPTADVIIRNPTHYAVALRYKIDYDNAPVVVAKGQDDVALRIVETGVKADVGVYENPELTRAIYAAADINEEIPMEYYAAVAELLALVYKMREERI